MRFVRRAIISVFTLATLFACSSNTATQFPPGLEPIEPVTTPGPPATATDPTPEALNLEQGQDDTSNYVHATGYVHAAVVDVWNAMKNPNVIVDRNHISSYTIDDNVEPGYDVSFVAHYEIDNVVTVKFDLTFREGVVSGTASLPTAVSVVYQKTYGSTLVSLMEGSIELTTISDTVTELQFAQRMAATGTDSTNIAAWTNDMFASIVASVHGQPLPSQ